MADMPQPESGLSKSEVEEIVKAAIAAIPQPEPGLTSAEAEQIARGVVASIPPRSAPAEYTRFLVNNAISRYETQGLNATLAYYNREESIDSQWYVFIIDENDLVIGHPDAHRLGLDLKGWVGTDANGYNFGPDMLSATEDGKWVSYVYRNPESSTLGSDHNGTLQLKNAWVVRHERTAVLLRLVCQRRRVHQGVSVRRRQQVPFGGTGGDHRILHRPRERLFRTGSDHRILQQRRQR